MFNIDIGSPQRQEQRKDENKDNDKDKNKDKKNQRQYWMMDATHLSHLTTSLQSPTVVRRKYSVAGLPINCFNKGRVHSLINY